MNLDGSLAGCPEAVANTGDLAMSTDLTETLIDPTKGYPKPPFEKQSQPWPGLARDMNPQPDHGEDSYVGSGRLKDRKALITGGDLGMGAAAAIAFAREGADVVINYLPDEQPDADHILSQIGAAGRKGFGIAGDLRDAAFCRDLVAQAVDKLGGLDLLVLQRRAATDRSVDPRHFGRGFRRDDQDQHLRAVLADQGRAARTSSRGRASSARRPNRRPIRRRICTIMR